MKRATILLLAECAALVALAAMLVALYATVPEHPGAGPVLVDALASGWKPNGGPK